MKKYIFCADNEKYNPPCCGFWSIDGRNSYPETFPEHGVEVDELVMKEFTTTVPDGKSLGADNQGYPIWIDLPSPTKEELIASANVKKNQLKAIADSEISWRQDAVDGGYAEKNEATELAVWKKYRVLLMRVDTSIAPVIEWPILPA
ncbi:tail fiber assembly protein [Yersinia enterocolitica]|nr:tail fiber assembly protein [Yersinia enterocolitica]